MKMTSLQN